MVRYGIAVLASVMAVASASAQQATPKAAHKDTTAATMKVSAHQAGKPHKKSAAKKASAKAEHKDTTTAAKPASARKP